MDERGGRRNPAGDCGGGFCRRPAPPNAEGCSRGGARCDHTREPEAQAQTIGPPIVPKIKTKSSQKSKTDAAPAALLTPAAPAVARKLEIAVLIVILLGAAALRLADRRQSPPGLNQDEAANAWNAWCLLNTGRDQAGVRWPLFYLRALGSNYTPLNIYLLVPIQAIGGMNVWTTRAPAAFGGILTVLLIWFVGRRLIDEGGIAELDEVVVRDRQHLSEEGMVLAVVAINKATGLIEGTPELVSRGHLQEEEAAAFLAQAREIVVKTVEDCTSEEREDSLVLSEAIRAELKRYFRKQTGTRPMIVPVIFEI